MTSTEFEDWVSYHSSLFNGFRQWLYPADGMDAQELQERDYRTCYAYESLEKFEVDDLKQATVKLRQRRETPAFSAHVTELVELLKSRAWEQEREPAQVTRFSRKCGLCEETGMVEVRWSSGHPSKTPGGNEVETFVSACGCGKGERYTPSFKRYDGSVMRPVQRPSLEELVARNRETLARLREAGDPMARIFELALDGEISPVALIGGEPSRLPA